MGIVFGGDAKKTHFNGWVHLFENKAATKRDLDGAQNKEVCAFPVSEGIIFSAYISPFQIGKA